MSSDTRLIRKGRYGSCSTYDGQAAAALLPISAGMAQALPRLETLNHTAQTELAYLHRTAASHRKHLAVSFPCAAHLSPAAMPPLRRHASTQPASICLSCARTAA